MKRERAGHRSGAHRIASTLGPDARALLDAARGGDDPSPSDRARTRDALMAAIAGATLTGAAATASAASALSGGGAASTAIGGATASTVVGGATASTVVGGATASTVSGATVSGTAVVGGTAAGASVLGVPVAMKVAALVLAMSATGALALGVSSGRVDPSTTASVAPASTPAPPSARSSTESIDDAPRRIAAEPEVVAARASMDVVPTVSTASRIAPMASPAARIEPASRARHDRAARAPELAPIASPIVSTLADEMALIRAAWADLRAGRGDAALASLDAHRSRFPEGALAPERDAARAIALCASARRDEGLAAASSFLHAHPRSPLAARVRDACR